MKLTGLITNKLKFLVKKNFGASSARNIGLQNAIGEYVCFIDADDYVGKNYISTLFEDIQFENGIDLVIQGLTVVSGIENSRVTFEVPILFNLKDPDSDFFRNINLFKFCGPYCKLFRTSIIKREKILFNDNIIFSEDFDFLARYLIFCRKINLSENIEYFYEKHVNSVSSRIYEFDKEYVGMRNLYKSLSSLLVEFKSSALRKQVESFWGYYSYRLIFANYKEGLSRQSRLSNYRSIEDTWLKCYKKYYVAETGFMKIVKFLFVNKYYSLLDIFMIIALK